MKIYIILFVAICVISCSRNNGTEKHQFKRDNIVDIRGKVKEIEIKNVLISSVARLQIVDDYLIIRDAKAYDFCVHLFGKEDYNYITSVIKKGRGPGEIANMGHLAVDNDKRKIFINDAGKYNIFVYQLDSMLNNPLCMPEKTVKMEKGQFLGQYVYVNDTLSIGRIIIPEGNAGFEQSLGKWNMNTGEITALKYTHPDIKKKRSDCAVSLEHGIYVEYYHHHDLFSICDLNGNLIYNVYGKDYNTVVSNRTTFFKQGKIIGDKIVLAHSGGNTFSNDEGGYYPTKFMVFDIDGNYIKTLETGCRIVDSCYDKENNRMVMATNEAMQFVYFNLDGLL